MSAVIDSNPPQTDEPKGPISDEDLIAAIDAAESKSYGSQVSSLTAELSAERALAIDLYMGRDVDPAPEGQSSVIDRSVFETIQWILPSLCRIFANGDDVVALTPTNADDVAQAKQETAYLNWLVTNKHPWFELFLEFATDALLTKNAYFLVYRDMSRQVEIEKYEGQTKEGLAMLLQDPGVQLISSRSYPAPDLPPEPVIDPQTGQPAVQLVMGPQGPVPQPIMQPAMLYDCMIRRTGDQKELCIRVLPPERVKVDQRAYSWRVDESCNYFEYSEDTTISALREQGFDVDDDIADDLDYQSQEFLARNQFGESNVFDFPVDPTMRRVLARMVWIRLDYDGDGKAELLQCLVVGRTVLYKEEVSRIPIASGVACPIPHRHMGLSVADMVADIQRIKTAILRQGLDNLYLSNNPQKVVNESLVNIDDVLISRPGGIMRSTDIVNGIRYEQTPFVFPQAVAGLEYMSQVAQNRTGVNNGFSGVDSANLNNIQPGTVGQLSSMAAERVVQIARVLAFGIEDLFSIVHEQVLKMGHKRQMVQLAGQWVEVDPGAWKKRNAFKIAVAFAAGNKDAQIGRLMAIRQAQVEALTMGIPVVTPENYYQTLVELTKAVDFTSPDRFWTDPIKMPPKPPPPPPPELIKAQMETQSSEKIKAAELAQKENESIRKDATERYAIDSNNGLEIVNKHITHGHDVAIEGLRASHTAILDAMNSKFDAGHTATSKAVEKATGTIQQHTASLGDIHQTLNNVFDSVKKAGALATAKRVVRKNPKGEIDGIDLLDHEGNVLASHTALKDKSGRVIGMQ